MHEAAVGGVDHVGKALDRVDELHLVAQRECDASVLRRDPEAKSLYASALLKAQLARAPLPLGCHWPSRSEHPLLQRVEMLGRAEPGVRGASLAWWCSASSPPPLA